MNVKLAVMLQSFRMKKIFPTSTATQHPAVTLGSYLLRGDDPSVEGAIRLQFSLNNEEESQTKAPFQMSVDDPRDRMEVIIGFQDIFDFANWGLKYAH